MVSTFTQWIETSLGIKPEYQTNLVETFLTFFIIFTVRWFLIRLTHKYQINFRIQYRINKMSNYVATFLALVIMSQIWIKNHGDDWDISTYFGLLSAGLAVAMKDPLVNMAGWLFIMWKRPFEVGDRIQIGDQKGDVIDQRIFMFTVLEIGNWVDADQSTGRVIHIPNGKIFLETLASYTKGFEYIWNEIPVQVTFESDWQKAKEILVEISHKHGETFTKSAEAKVKNASKRFMIFYKNLTPIVYTTVKDSGITLTIRYLTDPRKRRGSEQQIWEEVLIRFAEHQDIDLAYPTIRHYNNRTEGKQAIL